MVLFLADFFNIIHQQMYVAECIQYFELRQRCAWMDILIERLAFVCFVNARYSDEICLCTTTARKTHVNSVYLIQNGDFRNDSKMDTKLSQYTQLVSSIQ